MIGKEITDYLDYLETRFKQNTQLKKIDKGTIINEIVPCSLVVGDDFLSREVISLKDGGSGIKLEVLDVPGIYHY